VTTERFHITYAAHTASCTFLLDGEGVCRQIVMAPNASKRRDSSRTASRCVGAQYVASLDGAVAGCMVEMPRAGAAMLFARVDDRGRVALVRTGTVTRFESYSSEDPFDDVSVKTSAPEVPPQASPRPMPRPRRDADHDPHRVTADPDYHDPSDRTQRIRAISEEDLAEHEEEQELATGAYRAAAITSRPTVPPRTTLPSAGSPGSPIHATLRSPAVELTDEDDAYAAARTARGVLPRRSDPSLKAARRASSSRWPTTGDAKAVARRRRDR
jgi:hypothetical protein